MRFLVALVLGVVSAARAGAPDPGVAGRFAVASTTIAVVDGARHRTLTTEVWYPAREAERDAGIRPGRFPLVLLAHGYCGSRTNYEFLTTVLASRGFIVAAPDLPGMNHADCTAPTRPPAQPEDDLRFLRAAFHARTTAAASFVRHVRGARAAVIGHSLGTTPAIHATFDDPLLTPAVALAPPATNVPAGHGRRPVLVMGGVADTTIPIAAVRRVFDALPSPAVLVEIAGGTHDGFTDADPSLAADALARQQAITRRYVNAFVERWLARRRRFGRLLRAGDAAAPGGVTLVAR